MRLFLVSLFTLLGILIGSIYLIALPTAKSQIQSAFQQMGFQNTNIKGANFSLSGLNIDKIKSPDLSITNTSLSLYWPTYFFDKKIDSVAIEYLNLTSNVNFENQNLINQAPSSFGTLKLGELPNFEIKELQINLNSDMSAIGNIQKSGNKILADLKSTSETLKFQSKWHIEIDEEDDSLKIHTDIQDLSVKNKYLTLNRAQGWAAYENKDTQKLNAQLEAGSGSLFEAPLNNINLLMGQDGENHALLMRSSASGYPNITLKSDIEWSPDFDVKLFKTYFAFPSSEELASYFVNSNIFQTSQISKLNLNSTEVTFEYLPERRFADGPYPIDIKTLENDQEKLSGTVLIYPQEHDVRGTLTGKEEIITFISETVPLELQKISETSLRLDGNLTD